MIRPINVILALLACGSGLYLYQAKHRVNVLDRQIEATVKQTADLRARTRMLEADWMVLNDPQRLQALAGQLLTNLQPVAPAQFTTMAELDSRLPPVGPPPPQTSDLIATAGPAAVDRHDSGPVAAFAATPAAPAAADAGASVAAAAPALPAATAVAAKNAAAILPAPSMHGAIQDASLQTSLPDRTLHALPTHPPVTHPPVLHPPVIHAPPPHAAMAHPFAAPRQASVTAAKLPRALSPRPTIAHPAAPAHVYAARQAVAHPLARPAPVQTAARAPAAAFSGSLLGMAHDGMNPPAPVAPAPVAGPISQASWAPNR